jgi:Spy/CpxP family protein refolding chaperone
MFNRSKAMAGALILATFVAGAAVGVVGSSVTEDGDRGRRDRDRPRMSYAERLQNELGLTDAQRESVSAILDRRQDAMRQIWEETRPRFDSLRVQVRNEITALLDESQREKYQALIARADRPRGDSGRREGPPPPPTGDRRPR